MARTEGIDYDPLADPNIHSFCVCGRGKSLHPWTDPCTAPCPTFRCRRTADVLDLHDYGHRAWRERCPDCRAHDEQRAAAPKESECASR